jgi:hypothetical protein
MGKETVFGHWVSDDDVSKLGVIKTSKSSSRPTRRPQSNTISTSKSLRTNPIPSNSISFEAHGPAASVILIDKKSGGYRLYSVMPIQQCCMSDYGSCKRD